MSLWSQEGAGTRLGKLLGGPLSERKGLIPRAIQPWWWLPVGLMSSLCCRSQCH